MKALDLLLRLQEDGVGLSVDQGKLLLAVGEAGLDDDLIEQAKLLKSELIELVMEADKLQRVNISPTRIDYSLPKAFPLSCAQSRMLLMNDLSTKNNLFNLHIGFEISGALNERALLQAFELLVRRHDILRTRYPHDSGERMQLIDESAAIAINRRSVADSLAKENGYDVLLESERLHHFNLSDEWPIRVTLFYITECSWVLSVTVHHIAVDGWSAKTLVAELGRYYSEAAALNSLPSTSHRESHAFQYVDYVNWYAQWAASPEFAAQKSYWLNVLEGAPILNGLATDYPRPPVQSYRGARLNQPFSGIVSEKLHALALQQKVTPFIILQAVFASLLSRYSGETDLVVGTVVANRTPSEFIDTIGLFVNTLALRYQLKGDETFLERIEKAASITRGAFAHQQLPFDIVVDGLQLNRSSAFNPLVQIMLVLQEREPAKLELDALDIRPLPSLYDSAMFDLSVNAYCDSRGLDLSWEYSEDIFTKDTIEKISRHFDLLLTACLEAPDQVVEGIDLVVGSEIELLVEQGANSLPIFESKNYKNLLTQCIHNIFEAQVNQTPQAIALRDENGSICYRELDQRANALAFRISQIAPCGARVGVYLDKSIDMIAAILGVFKSGRTFVPLDVHAPPDRIKSIIADAEIAFIVAADEVATEYIFANVSNVLKMPSGGEETHTGNTVFESAVDIEQPAYIIYTSGSSGRPKGVLMSHKSLSLSFLQNQEVWRITQEDVVASLALPVFDISLLETLLPLLFGAQVLLVAKSSVVDIEALHRTTQDVTVLHAVPSLMSAWLEKNKLVGGDVYPQLRLLLVGGDRVPHVLLENIKQWRSDIEVIELYGPTEAAIVCSSFRFDGRFSASNCIGKPHSLTQFFVLNAYGKIQPQGVAGELCIASPALAEGYVGNKKLTDEKFVNLILGNKSRRIYKTGDYVRLVADGNYEYLGRTDDQISLRGFRIEPGEIEAIVEKETEVKRALVTVCDTGEAGQLLVLYYTSTQGSHVEELEQAIRRVVRENLPDYMRPSFLYHLDEFPLNSNGKVTLSQLPIPKFTTIDSAKTAVEKTLVEIWCLVLSIENVSVNQNFFEVGGHSLLVNKLVILVKERFDVDVPVALFFEYPTVRESAVILEQVISAGQSSGIPDEKQDELDVEEFIL